MDTFHDIVRPTLVLDEDCARRNIARMAEKARRQAINFRPHFKTHQSAAIGEWFRDEEVCCITVSSVEMAAYFARHGWDDITIAFPVNLRQMDELSALACQVRLGLLVESVESVAALRLGLHGPAAVWIKIDVGAGRTGIPWDQPEAVGEVLSAIHQAPNLEACGLLTHAGHTYHASSHPEIRQIYATARQRLQSLRTSVETHPDQNIPSKNDGTFGAGYLASPSQSADKTQNFASLQISVGDTPACSIIDDLSGVDEIRPGNFVFYDAQQYLLGSCAWEDVAVAVACPVVALHPERQEAVIYGGAIHLSKDTVDYEGHPAYGLAALPEGNRWGRLLGGAYVRSLSQEHGIVHLRAPAFGQIRVGDILFIIPAHSCLTVSALGQYRTLTGELIPTMNVEE
jgi:D-serine deaminase-like pyridoxal phosphate-dependent protein